ncbi:hypothetical protein [Ruegeria sp.]|uniref:hypothetical protein n=1 Tax=Ruegeria sp. TaxID=1879320 RepID=UPI003B5C5D67
MARTLKDLLLALLNATLILLAICLFLGWKLASTVDGITTAFSEKVAVVAPLREDIRSIRGELTALRSDLANIQAEGLVADTAAAQRVSAALNTLDNLQEQMQATQSRISEITDAPENLINTAIEKSADVVTDRIDTLRGCVPAS